MIKSIKNKTTFRTPAIYAYTGEVIRSRSRSVIYASENFKKIVLCSMCIPYKGWGWNNIHWKDKRNKGYCIDEFCSNCSGTGIRPIPLTEV